MRFAVLGLLGLFGCAEPQRIDGVRVVVLDPEFRVLRTVDDPNEIDRFSRLWLERSEVEDAPRHVSEYAVVLDISANHGGGRWAYRPDGLTTPLSHKALPVYRVSDPESLNELLQIPDPSP